MNKGHTRRGKEIRCSKVSKQKSANLVSTVLKTLKLNLKTNGCDAFQNVNIG